MTTLLVIDMQVGSFVEATPRHDADGVVARINTTASAVRRSGGSVVFVQHDGPTGDRFEPGSSDWQLLASLDRLAGDGLVRKRACDSFYETDLDEVLRRRDERQLLVTGCATDFCVDTTVRAAASRDFDVTVVRDGHTTTDRPHLDAATIVTHHNYVWEDLILPKRRVQVLPAAEIVRRLEGDS